MIKLVETIGHSAHNPPVEYEHDSLLPFRESPDRVDAIRDFLIQHQMAELVFPPEPDLDALLPSAHYPEYLSAIARLSLAAEEQGRYLYPYVLPIRPEMDRLPDLPYGLLAKYAFDLSSPIGPATWRVAQASASAALASALLLLNHPQSPVYSLCRPPGHHAGRDFMGGYCYLNNAALAACVVKSRGRVAIIDIDYHHGNGTQHIFWDDPDVFFLSLHGDPQFEYPHYAGFADETGGPHAPRANLNMPLPAGTTPAAYLAALERGLEAVAGFAPETIIISLGVDTFKDDPLGTFRLGIEDYSRIATLLSSLNRPTLLVQEGGYANQHLPLLIASFLEGWHR